MADIGSVFAQNLKALRAERGWNQNRLAEASSLSLEQVKRYETNASWVGKEAIAAIARGLSVPESRLFLDPAAIPKPSKEDALAMVAEALGLPMETRKPPPVEPPQPPPRTPLQAMPTTKDELLAAIDQIHDPILLGTVIEFVANVARLQNDDSESGSGTG